MAKVEVKTGDFLVEPLSKTDVSSFPEYHHLQMPAPPPNKTVFYSFPSSPTLVNALAAFIINAQTESIEKKNRFTLAISGGSLPKMLSGLIGNSAVKWDKW